MLEQPLAGQLTENPPHDGPAQAIAGCGLFLAHIDRLAAETCQDQVLRNELRLGGRAGRPRWRPEFAAADALLVEHQPMILSPG